MSKKLLLLALAISLPAVLGCGGEKPEAEKSGKDGGVEGANAAVKPVHWGEERVMYAEYEEWENGQITPGGEQWESPPTDVTYMKFTYHGPKLVKLEGLDADGEPTWFSKMGVRMEWKYAAHGGVIEEAAFDEEGTVHLRDVYRYSDDGRCVARTMLGTDGVKVNRSTYTYSDDGKTRTERLEVYDEDGKVIRIGTAKARWDPDKKAWETTSEEWEDLDE